MSVKPKALEVEPKLCKPSSFDTFETTKLTRELGDAVEYDRLYRKTDDLKKRVIVEAADYDEFRNRVLCADLKPLSSSDIKNIAQGKPAVNMTASGGGGGALAKAAAAAAGGRKKRGLRKSKKPAAPPADASVFAFAKPTCCPANAADFGRDWRRNCPTTADKLAYVALVTHATAAAAAEQGGGGAGGGAASTVAAEEAGAEEGAGARAQGGAWAALFPTEMEASLLASIVVTVLASAMAPQPAAAAVAAAAAEEEEEEEAAAAAAEAIGADMVLAALRGLCGVGRFALNVSFLSKAEKATSAALFDWLVGEGLAAADVDEVRARYQLQQ